MVTPSNFMSAGGLADATSILRDFHKLSLNESNKSRELENEVITQLTGLRSDLQQKIKEIKSLSGDFKNSVGKEQDATRKAVRALQDSLGSIDHDAASTAGKGDPFLVKMGVDRQLEKQIEEENYLHRVSCKCIPLPRLTHVRRISTLKPLVESSSPLLLARFRRLIQCWQTS